MSIDLIFENAQLKGRVIALDAEVKCLEAVIRSHERVDCLSVTSLKKQLVEADAENARLKAEVEKLTFDPMSYLDDHGEWMPRYTHLVAVERLKAEVERLNSELHTCSCANAKMNMHMNENARLKAEVERLTKAGDLICRMAGNNEVINRHWKAAKKGGQS